MGLGSIAARRKAVLLFAFCLGTDRFVAANSENGSSADTPPSQPQKTANTCVGKVLATALGLDNDLQLARHEISERLRKSPNARPIADFILQNESPVRPTMVSQKVPGFGQVRIKNDFRVGTSRVEWLDEAGVLKQRIFDSKKLFGEIPRKLAREIRWGRVDSVHLAPDASQIIVRYRTYAATDPKRFLEFHFPTRLKANQPVDPEAAPFLLLRNYQEGAPYKVADGNYYVRNYGMNASTDIVFVANDGTPSVVFSTLDEDPSNTVQFGSLAISPDEKYLAITTYADGNQDHFRMKVIDRKSGELKRDDTTRSTKVTWDPPPIPDGWVSTVARPQGHHLYLAKDATGEVNELRLMPKNSTQSQLVAKAGQDFFIESAEMMGDEVAAYIRKGGERYVMIYGMGPQATEHPLEVVQMPNGVSLTGFAWANDKKTAIKFLAQSVVNPVQWVTRDLKTKAYSPPDYVSRALTRDNVEYVSSLGEIPSRDGTPIPVRLSHRKNLPANGHNPVLMEVYGGFGRTNENFDPTYDAMNYEFLRRGGVLATPAPRGGGELGEKWHQSGQGLNKVHTLEDITATARFLVREKVTEPRKIILTGSSNGGFVAAATALQAPDAYGLVIPKNGVLDLARTEELDRLQNGWIQEYGSNAVEAERLNKERLSPVLQATNLGKLPSAPEFLIVNGANDSRVNPKHSVNFYRALRKSHPNPASVNLLSTQNSGHFGTSPDAEKLIGWNTRALIWTRIFDFLGWKF